MRNSPNTLLTISLLISSSEGSGSGFFYHCDKALYLVTAKHVLFTESNKFRKN